MEIKPVEYTIQRGGVEYTYYYLIIPAQIARFFEITGNTKISFELKRNGVLMKKLRRGDRNGTKVRERTFKEHGGKQYYLSIPAKIANNLEITEDTVFDFEPVTSGYGNLFVLEKKGE